MKNLTSKIIYFILFLVLCFLGTIFISAYGVARNTYANPVSPGFFLLIFFIVIGLVVAGVMFSVWIYKGGDVDRAKKDAAAVLGELTEKWKLAYNDDLLVISSGQTSKGNKVQISFIPLPVRIGITIFYVLFPYKGVGISSVTVSLDDDGSGLSMDSLQPKLEEFAQKHIGRVTKSGNTLVYMHKYKGDHDSERQRLFFKDLEVLLEG
jgi:hypothetical protein